MLLKIAPVARGDFFMLLLRCSSRLLLSLTVVRMLWWLLILGVSSAAVVSIAVLLYTRVRRQLKQAPGHAAESDSLDQPSSTPDA